MGPLYRDKKVVGVFVRFFHCAASLAIVEEAIDSRRKQALLKS
jgi:hypothetical protein